MDIVIPLRTETAGTNLREHWAARSRRVKLEREAVAWFLTQHPRVALPCTVLLTRLGPTNGLDGDNLQGSLKAVRDQVATWLCVDDRCPSVQWHYAQRRAKNWAVHVEVKPSAVELTN